MKTCTVSEAKGKLGELADHPDEFDALIQAGKDSPHRTLSPKVLGEIWKRGRALAKGRKT